MVFFFPVSAHCVKSNMVYTLCKHMVYIFSLGSSTKRQLRFMV